MRICETIYYVMHTSAPADGNVMGINKNNCQHTIVFKTDVANSPVPTVSNTYSQQLLQHSLGMELLSQPCNSKDFSPVLLGFLKGCL